MNPVGGPAACRITGVLGRMDALKATLPSGLPTQRHFLGTYRRTTVAVGRALADGRFEDPDWVDRWDAVFADLYLDAVHGHLAGRTVALPWRLAFAAPPHLAAARHVLLGMNAHINYDLPQALLAVVDDADFADPDLLARRRADHERIDDVLAAQVTAEDEAIAASGRLRSVDRLLRPLNRRSTVRFLRQARRKVWHNTVLLQRARARSADSYAARLVELEERSAERTADLIAPGPVLVRLALGGFGVTLPD